MLILSPCPIEDAPDAFAPGAETGAQVIFEGRVRRTNRGREVAHIDYEAYEELAARECERIVEALRRRLDVEDVCLRHRIGRVRPGEQAVRVRVAARDRATAFRACNVLVDALKHNLPIWKHEFYTDGSSHWLQAPPDTERPL